VASSAARSGCRSAASDAGSRSEVPVPPAAADDDDEKEEENSLPSLKAKRATRYRDLRRTIV